MRHGKKFLNSTQVENLFEKFETILLQIKYSMSFKNCHCTLHILRVEKFLINISFFIIGIMKIL